MSAPVIAKWPVLAQAAIGLVGNVAVTPQLEVADTIDRLGYRHDDSAAALDCWRRLHEGYAYAGEVVTVQRDGEGPVAFADRHAEAMRAAVRTADGADLRRLAGEADYLATSTITALARSGAKCAEGYSADGAYSVTVNGFTRIGTDPARLVLAAARAAGLELHAAVIALRAAVCTSEVATIDYRAEVVPCGAGLDAHIEPVPGCTEGRVVATLRERETGRMAHHLAFAEGATRDEAVRAAVEAFRAALTIPVQP